MTDVAPVNLPFLQIYTSRGKTFAYFRRGKVRIRLPAPSDPGFGKAYDLALNGAPPVVKRPQPLVTGSLRALVALYKAEADFLELSKSTQVAYSRHLESLLERYGDSPVAEATRSWVKRRHAELIATPRSANYRLSVIRKLFSFGVEHGWMPSNPASRIKPLKTGTGHRIWTDEEIAALTSPAAGDVALPVMIALHTAQRQGDVLALSWSSYSGTTIKLRQNKTAVALTIPVSEELRAVLDAMLPPRSVVICLTASGRPWKPDWFKHRFAAVRAELGLPDDCHFHGLRHTAATRLAESGASEKEIRSITGHKTPSMVARYTQQADQERLANSAVARLPVRQKKNGTV